MSAVFGLLGACFLGLGWALQQHAAYAEPLGEMLHWRLIAHLMRRPIWLAGLGAMVCGMVLSGLAFAHADIARVEPILATNLVFALFFAHLIYRERITRSEGVGTLLATGGVAMFLLSGRPDGDVMSGNDVGRWTGAIVVAAIAIVFVVVGRGRSLGVRAMLLASAAGMLYGIQDTLTRGTLLVFDRQPSDLFTSWQPYTLIVVAGFGLLLTQSAFDAAPLQISLPATTVAEPVTGIILGIAIFHEQLEITPLALAGEVAGLAAMVVGIMVLGRSPMLCKNGPCVPQPRSAPDRIPNVLPTAVRVRNAETTIP